VVMVSSRKLNFLNSLPVGRVQVDREVRAGRDVPVVRTARAAREARVVRGRRKDRADNGARVVPVGLEARVGRVAVLIRKQYSAGWMRMAMAK
jgi:hypothetical protein